MSLKIYELSTQDLAEGIKFIEEKVDKGEAVRGSIYPFRSYDHINHTHTLHWHCYAFNYGEDYLG